MIICILQAQGIGKLPQHHTAARAQPALSLGHLPTFPPRSTWQSGKNAGLVPREGMRSLALPNGSVPFGNSLSLSGMIYL